MSIRGGYLVWDTRHYKEVMHLDGMSWHDDERWGGFSAQPVGDPFQIVNDGLDGTHTLQNRVHPIDDVLRPDIAMPLEFSIDVVADSDEEFANFLAVPARAGAAWFVPYHWVIERITNAVTSQVYKLWRPMAYSVAPEATSMNHAPVFRKNGVIDTNCVTISGSPAQTATINEDGDISIFYCPAMRVVASAVGFTLPEVNDLRVRMTLREVFE
jgi:hypothetical protein